MTVEELRVIIKAETADIKKKTQDVRESLKGLKSQSEKVSQSTKTLEKAHREAEKATKSHNKEVKQLGQELSKTLKQFTRQRDAINRCKIAANQNSAAYDKLKNKADAQNASIADQRAKVEQLEKTYQKLSKAMNQYGSYDSMQTTEQGMTKQMSDLIQQRRSLQEAAKYMQASGSKTTLTSEGVMDKDQLASAMKRNSLATEDLRSQLYGVRDAIEQVQNAGLKNLDDNSLNRMSRDLDKARQKLRDLETGLRDTERRMDVAGQKCSSTAGKLSQMQGAAAQTEDRIGKLRTELRRFSGVGSALNGIKGKLKGIGDAAKKSISGLKGARKEGNALSRSLGFLGMTFKYTAAFMAVMAAMNGAAEGFKNLSQYSQRTNADLSMLMSSLTQLKNSLATAFAPILSVVAPILNTLIGYLNSAMTALAHFFAAFTGQDTVVVAKKVNQDFASSVADAGSATEDANKKAEKYQKTLMGFDQINKLDEPDTVKDSSGGSAGELSPADMFETVEVENKFANWADKIKEAWAKADFTEIGETLGNKLNAALSNINWSKIQSTASRIAKSIATFLNGFIQGTDWSLVGKTLAEGFNTIFEFAYTFVTTFDWKKFGTAIGNAINGFIRNLNLAQAGQTLSAGVKGILDTAIKILTTTNWNQIGQKIADFICNIDWIGVAKRVISLLGNALVSAVDTIGGFIDKVGDYIAEYIESGDIWKDLFDFGKTVLEIGIKLVKVGWKTLVAFVGALVKVGIALVKSGWKAISSFIGTAVKVGVSLIRKGWSALSSWVGTKVTAAVGLVKRGWKTLQRWSGATSPLNVGVSLMKKGWKTLKDWVFGGLDFLRLKFGLPKIGIKWSTKELLGFKISYPSGFYTYAKGGFPEEGPFMMNRGEIAGKFSNGKTVVANNQQITDGIAAAVYKAFTAAGGGGQGNISATDFRSAMSQLLDAVKAISFYIGDEQIARHATRGQAKLDRRLSPIQAR